MSAVLSPELILGPVDRVRRAALSLLGARAGFWMANRDARVALVGSMVVLGALATTALVPVWMLALGPIVLGVPHIVSDIRYLWVRPGLDRRASVWLAVGVPLLIGATTGHALWGLVAAIGALAVARTTVRRRVLGLAIVLPLLVLAARHRRLADLIFAHAHNAIAVALWGAWRPRQSRLHAIPLLLFVAASVAIVLGALSPLMTGPETGTPMSGHMRALAPLASPELGERLVLLYAFAQSVHYGVWLRLVPEDDRPRAAPRTFVSSYRALSTELGPLRLVVAGLVALAVAVWATADLAAARSGYLRFAGFHGQLELAALAFLFAEGRRIAAPSRPQRAERGPA